MKTPFTTNQSTNITLLLALMVLLFFITPSPAQTQQRSVTYTPPANSPQHQTRPNNSITYENHSRNQRAFNASIWTNTSSYSPSRPVEIGFRVSQDAYVFVFVTDRGGYSRQIFPNAFDQNNLVPANQGFNLPDGNYSLDILKQQAGQQFLNLVAVFPYSPDLQHYMKFTRQNPFPTRAGGAEKLIRILENSRRDPSQRLLIGTAQTRFYVQRGVREEYGTGRVSIDTSPTGADIFIDGYLAGATPATLSLPFGKYSVLLKKPGYYDKNIPLNINRSDLRYINARLERAY